MQILIVLLVLGSISVAIGWATVATARGGSWGPAVIGVGFAVIGLFGISTGQATNQFVILSWVAAVTEFVVSRGIAARANAAGPSAAHSTLVTIGVLIGIAATLGSAFLLIFGLLASLGGGLFIPS